MKKIIILGFFSAVIFFPVGVFAFEKSGPYASIGPAGVFQIGGDHRHFDPGPGFQVNLGYDWEKFGVRGKFLVSSHDESIPFRARDTGVEFVATSVDGLLYPLALAGHSDNPFQPYFFGGIGAYFLTEGSVDDGDGAAGFAGNIGLGFRYRVVDFLSLGVEQGFHFVEFADNGGYDLYFLSLAGTATFHF